MFAFLKSIVSRFRAQTSTETIDREFQHELDTHLELATQENIRRGMAPEEAEVAAGLVVRGKHCYICLNAYPYTSGHVMVVPYAHVDRLAGLGTEAAHEMIDLALKTERVLEQLYRPHGLNFGMNLGKAAGAGVAGHLHLHALPRWLGDTNFMTTVAETRVLPEDLPTTWRRMREAYQALEEKQE